MTFDSTQFPDTIPLDATMYAIARDAAGNRPRWATGSRSTTPGGERSPARRSRSRATRARDRRGGVGADRRHPDRRDPRRARRRAQLDAARRHPAGRRSRSAGDPARPAIPLGRHPARPAIGFTSTNLNQNGLGGVPLSSIPLNSTTDTWQERLDANPAFAGSPVQSVTLARGPGHLGRHDADAGDARRSRPRREPARRHPARRHRARRPAARRRSRSPASPLDAGREPRRLVRVHQHPARLQLHRIRTRSAARR